jgi:ribosome-dependent ATPase
MPSRAEIILGYVGGVHRNYMLDLGRRTLGDEPKLLPADIETRFRYNPSFESIYAMVPSLMGTLLFLIPAILMAVSVVREKELGSIYNFYVTPVTRIEFLLGKQLPYILIAMVNCALLVLMAIIIFDVPLKGSLFAFLLGALLYVSVTTGFGLLVSTFTKTQAAAILTTTILCMLPTVQYSGMLQPVSTLEGTAKFIGTMWPATYFMHISVGAFTKALTMKDLLADLTVLTICLSIFTMLSIFMLKKQDR